MEQRTPLDYVMFSVDEEEYARRSLEQVRRLAGWLSNFGVSSVTVDVRGASKPKESMTFEDVDCEVLSKEGREDVVEAVRALAVETAEGRLEPEALEDSDVQNRLPGDSEVDLVVKTGEQKLVDSAIYGTVYSEVRFVDSWTDLDRETVADIVEDFEETERRYGR